MKRVSLCLILLSVLSVPLAFAQEPSINKRARALAIFPYRTVGIPVVDVDHIITGFTVKDIDEKQCITALTQPTAEVIGFEQATCTPPTLTPAVVTDIDETKCNYVWTLNCVPGTNPQCAPSDRCLAKCGKTDPKPYNGKEPPWAYEKCYQKTIQCPASSVIVQSASMSGFDFKPAVQGEAQCSVGQVDSIECLTAAAVIEPNYEDITEEFSYTAEEVVENIHMGENVKIRAIGMTFKDQSVKYRFRVVRVVDGVSHKVLYQSDSTTFTGVGKFVAEYDYTFVQNGLHRLVFQVIRPNGSVSKVFSRQVAVN